MKDLDCLFCKIIDGSIPSYKVYEDENTFVFLDINPDEYGHMLVISKDHYESALKADNNTINSVFNVATKMGNLLIEKLHADGINILTNCNEVAGQVIKHFHVHVIPRYKNRLDVKQLNKDEKYFSEILEKLK